MSNKDIPTEGKVRNDLSDDSSPTISSEEAALDSSNQGGAGHSTSSSSVQESKTIEIPADYESEDEQGDSDDDISAVLADKTKIKLIRNIRGEIYIYAEILPSDPDYKDDEGGRSGGGESNNLYRFVRKLIFKFSDDGIEVDNAVRQAEIDYYMEKILNASEDDRDIFTLSVNIEDDPDSGIDLDLDPIIDYIYKKLGDEKPVDGGDSGHEKNEPDVDLQKFVNEAYANFKVYFTLEEQKQKQAEIRSHIENLRYTDANRIWKGFSTANQIADGGFFAFIIGAFATFPDWVKANANNLFPVSFFTEVFDVFMRIGESATSKNFNIGKLKPFAINAIKLTIMALAILVPWAGGSVLGSITVGGVVIAGPPIAFAVMLMGLMIYSISMGGYYARLSHPSSGYPDEERKRFRELSDTYLDTSFKLTLMTAALISMMMLATKMPSAAASTLTIYGAGHAVIFSAALLPISVLLIAVPTVYFFVQTVTSINKPEFGQNAKKFFSFAIALTSLVLLSIFPPAVGVAGMIGITAALTMAAPFVVFAATSLGEAVINKIKQVFFTPTLSEEEINALKVEEEKANTTRRQIELRDALDFDKEDRAEQYAQEQNNKRDKFKSTTLFDKYTVIKPVGLTPRGIQLAVKEFDEAFSLHHLSPGGVPKLSNNRIINFFESAKNDDKAQALIFLQNYRNAFAAIIANQTKNAEGKFTFDLQHNAEINGLKGAVNTFEYTDIKDLTTQIEKYVNKHFPKAYLSMGYRIGYVHSLFEQAHKILLSAELVEKRYPGVCNSLNVFANDQHPSSTAHHGNRT